MQQREDTKVRLSGLKPGVYEQEIVLGDSFFEGFENEEIEGGEVHYSVRLEKSERITMLTITLEGWLATWCDRCLGRMKVKIGGVEHLNVRFSDSEQTDDEETAIVPEDANEIDLAPWLYEYAAVRLPLQHVHPDGECDPEVTQYIGAENEEGDADYVDPRWEALKKLK